MSDVNVTQAARDALADYYAIPGVGDYENSVAERVREGLHEDPLLRAFARFERDTIARLSAQTPESATRTMGDVISEAITLIDEINERATSRVFFGISQTLHAKLCTIRATLARHRLTAQTPEPATQQPRADVVEAMANVLANADLDGPDPEDYWTHLANAALRTQAPASDEVREAVIEARLALANWSKYENETDELAYQGNKVAKALETILAALGAKP